MINSLADTQHESQSEVNLAARKILRVSFRRKRDRLDLKISSKVLYAG